MFTGLTSFSGNPHSALTHFKLPNSFDLVFQSEKIGDSNPVCIWSLQCPANYVPLGHVATTNCTEPIVGDAHCVLASLTEKIDDLRNIWDRAEDCNHGFIQFRV